MPKKQSKSALRSRIQTVALLAFAVIVLSAAAFVLLRPEPAFTSVSTLPTASTSPTPTPRSSPIRALFFGDSIIQGSGTQPGTPNMSTITASKLGWVTTVDGFGGTGWTGPGTLPGGRNYHDRIHALDLSTPYDVILLEGGTNDVQGGPKGLRPLVLDSLTYLRSKQPHARIIVLGPYLRFGSKPSEMALAVRDVIASAAKSQGDPFIDFFPWTAAAPVTLRSGDGYHPNPQGHEYLAERLAEALMRYAPA